MPKRDALVIRAFALWTVYVWGTRIWNVVGDDQRDFAFKAVHVALAAVSVTLAVATWFIVARNRRASRVGPGTADVT